MSSEITYNQLQKRFAEQYQRIFDDKLAPKTIVVIPSLTLDHQILSKVKGHFYYEERMLCMLMLLRMPETRITFVTSFPISPLIIDYYLHMLPGITPHHARNRLTLLSCYDAGNLPLTIKILKRPRLINRIKTSIVDENAGHLVFFNTTEAEKELAIALNLPIYGSDPNFNYLGSKSGCRQLFKECGVPVPFGYENLYSENDIVQALVNINKQFPNLEKAVVKINEGFSGDGNAVFYFKNMPSNIESKEEWIAENIKQNLKIVAKKLKYSKFISKLESTGGIVEVFIDGEVVMSPSVQCRINPLGEVCIISTHDQVLTGENSQVFVGATFPADLEYSKTLSGLSFEIGAKMRDIGVLGRFGIDFMSVKRLDQWTHYAIEINLRKGGTTHPFLMLQFLTDGHYDIDSGEYLLPDGSRRYYFATDNLQSDSYKGLTPLDLIDIAMHHGLHYDHSHKEGVMFHLISALSQYGKIGLVSIGATLDRAKQFYQEVVDVLNKETTTTMD
ncbi:MAG: carboxylate-amine ligase [Saprospiraceae bacterium]|nr:carboxylate-amine ligase [Saprospiraceae bacterium]